MRDDGEITLNYVAPSSALSRRQFGDARGAGGEGARARRCAAASLLSTETAHRFYLARGYRDEGPPVGKFGTAASYPYESLVPT